jgi:hypothetical protein
MITPSDLLVPFIVSVVALLAGTLAAIMLPILREVYFMDSRRRSRALLGLKQVD